MSQHSAAPSPHAVIFDLFGTLVENLDPSRFVDATAAIAAVLELEADVFRQEWSKTFVARMDGSLPDGDEQFRPVVDALGHSVSNEQLVRASDLRRDLMREALTPRPGAVECLRELRARGLAIALASDCSSETPSLLDETPLGEYLPVRACSALLGARKPDPVVYRHALEGLGVAPADTLYVGDGNSEELPGASRLGMTTVWVDNRNTQYWKERFVPGGDHSVVRIDEVVAIVDRLRGAGADSTRGG